MFQGNGVDDTALLESAMQSFMSGWSPQRLLQVSIESLYISCRFRTSYFRAVERTGPTAFVYIRLREGHSVEADLRLPAFR